MNPQDVDTAAVAGTLFNPADLVPMLIGLGTSLMIAVLTLVVGWVVSKWARKLALSSLDRAKVDIAVARFVSYIVQYTVLAATIIAALGAVGVETTSLVAVLASAGLAVGLALQGSLSSFASGVMILLFRPFELGDVITAGGHTGGVVDIGLFATTLHTPSNEKIILPNSAVTGGSIVNITTLGTRRVSVAVGVAYGASVSEVIGVLERAAKGVPNTLDDPGPGVAFTGLGASSLDFAVMVWGKSEDFLAISHDLRTAIYVELEGAGIDIPYNQIVVHQADAAQAAAAK